MHLDFDIIAVLVSGSVFFILGGLWYAVVFSKPWQEALNFNEAEISEQTKDFPKSLLTHFIAGILTSIIMVWG